MDGLECSVILKKDLERTVRIDSEFYSKENSRIEKTLQKTEYGPLTQFVDISDGNHMAISDKFTQDGIPYYRGQDVKTFFVEDSTPVCIDETSYNSPSMVRSHIRKGDVLLSIVGTIGRLSLVNSEQKATCSCKLAILRPRTGVHGEMIAAFLSTKYGQNQIKKYTRGAVQMGLILEDMDQLLVPKFGNNFTQKILNLFLIMNQIKMVSKDCYDQANNRLNECLECECSEDEMQVVCSTKTLAESLQNSGRLDAEYYQPKYERIESILQNKEHTTLDKISDIVAGDFVAETQYGDVGVPYIRGADITSLCVDFERATKVDCDVSADKVLNTGDLVFAMIGSVGNVSINRGNVAIASNNLGIIRLYDKKLSHYLLVYLLSDIGQKLFEKYQTRTAQPKISKDAVGGFYVPILSDEDIEYISEKVKKSFELEEKSQEILKCIIRAIEIAIEENENVAEQWLNKKGVMNECQVIETG